MRPITDGEFMNNPLQVKLLDGYGDPNDTVTHDGVPYDLGIIRKGICFAPRVLFEVDSLKWLLDECPWSEEDEARIPIINMRRPIFVVWWQDKQCCIDGYHRLTNAVRLGLKHLPGVWVPDKVMLEARK
jgi:hypothetical protein